MLSFEEFIDRFGLPIELNRSSSAIFGVYILEFGFVQKIC